MATQNVPADDFDDLREQADAPKAEAWKPENPGDEIAGTVDRLDTGFDREGTQHGIVVLKTADGTIRPVWLLTEALRNQMLRADPHPGDRILVRYLGKKKAEASGRTYHDFRVVSDRQSGGGDWWERQRSKGRTGSRPADGDEVTFSDDVPVPPEPDDDTPAF